MQEESQLIDNSQLRLLLNYAYIEGNISKSSLMKVDLPTSLSFFFIFEEW